MKFSYKKGDVFSRQFSVVRWLLISRESPTIKLVTFNDISSIAQKLCSEQKAMRKNTAFPLVVWIIFGGDTWEFTLLPGNHDHYFIHHGWMDPIIFTMQGFHEVYHSVCFFHCTALFWGPVTTKLGGKMPTAGTK